MSEWRIESYPALHWTRCNDGEIMCELCPRHCHTKDGQFGVCQVRGHKGGEYRTFIYGKSVTATEEVIETEAVNHYWPGAKILSLGNVGCMMSCDYCQNWQTSQVEYLNPKMIHFYTPEQIVDMALSNNIKILSWTYNDPVVWHEFVIDTAKLARMHGIKNLYKSAFYIEKKPVAELIEVIDIFSLSLKSMCDSFYKRFTRGQLQPVLDRIRQVYESERHLEISQLLVTGLNEKQEDIRKTIDWFLDNLDDNVPLHFVAFHPAFKYKEVGRTPLTTLIKAKEMAVTAGINNVYLGNVHERVHSSTFCKTCSSLLVDRCGLIAKAAGLDFEGKCSQCGTQSSIIVEPANDNAFSDQPTNWSTVSEYQYLWNDEVKSTHIELHDKIDDYVNIKIEHIGSGVFQTYKIGKKGLGRVIVSKIHPTDQGIRIYSDKAVPLKFLPVLDRAHFPTSESVEEAR